MFVPPLRLLHLLPGDWQGSGLADLRRFFFFFIMIFGVSKVGV